MNHIDQKRGACIYTNERKTRYCIIFYDKLITITSPNSYKRETYVQIKRQNLEGTSWTENIAFDYYYFTNINVREKNASEDILLTGESNGHSADTYYSLNFDYQMVLEGQAQYDYADTYWYITEFYVHLAPVGVNGRVAFDGKRQSPTIGPFIYHITPAPSGMEWMTDF